MDTSGEDQGGSGQTPFDLANKSVYLYAFI